MATITVNDKTRTVTITGGYSMLDVRPFRDLGYRIVWLPAS